MASVLSKTGVGSEVFEIQSQLSGGERLLWSGKPAGGIRLQAADAFLIPFSIFWAGFAIFWESSVLSINAPLLFKLWGVPFVLVGLYVTAGRFAVDAWQRRRTLYAVTDRRIIIVSNWFGKNVQSLPLNTLSGVNLKSASAGRGTITFGSPLFWMPVAMPTNWPGARRYSPPTFFMIPDADEVYDLIMRAQAATASGADTRPF